MNIVIDFPSRIGKGPPVFDVIVIGAGASGMMAAGRAGELGARVLLLEKMSRAGLKLGITGKGRCNLTNEGEIPTFLKKYYPDGRFLRNGFARFFNQDLIRFFEERGVPLTVEREGGSSLDPVGPWMWCRPC